MGPGGEKAALLVCARRPCRAVAVEFGAFIGYSSLLAGGRGVSPVVTFELDPVHAVAARVLSNSVCSAAAVRVEVWVGLVADVLPRLPEDFGRHSPDSLFMDHCGTRYHTEVRIAQSTAALSQGAGFVADNVLEP